MRLRRPRLPRTRTGQRRLVQGVMLGCVLALLPATWMFVVAGDRLPCERPGQRRDAVPADHRLARLPHEHAQPRDRLGATAGGTLERPRRGVQPSRDRRTGTRSRNANDDGHWRQHCGGGGGHEGGDHDGDRDA